ncbi:hypothetical protein [Natronospora cellulosivora (SeqCode)]
MKNASNVGFYPFWFWNDKLDADEIRYQIKEMYDKGIKGFYIHPRQGLQEPYLSEAFFKMIDVAIAAAEEYDLDVLLYDEYPYPSGVAGGEVTLGNPHYYATSLIQKTYNVSGGKIRLALPQGKILSAKAFPIIGGSISYEQAIELKDHIGIVLAEDSYVVNGLTDYNQKRYFASNPTPTLEIELEEGEYKIFLSVQAEVKNHKYWYNFVDILNPEAVKHFVELTHERYRKRYGNLFGKRIKSIFVDEIEPSWSNCIPEAFLKEYDYNLCEYLHVLQDENHPEFLKVSSDLFNLKYKLFINSFEKPIKEWCQRNKVNYCGEKPSLRLSQLKYMDIPGCEPGHTKAGAKLDILGSTIRGNAKATSSAAYFYEKEGSLCECYHSIGWSGTLQDAKIIAEGLLLSGIKYLVPHGFFYSTHALKKHDAPPSFFFQMPYWSFFKELSDRVDLIAEKFNDTYIDAETLVFDPNSGLPSRQELKDYEKLINTLMDNHIDFHIVDTDILESGKIEDGILKIKDLKIKLIIVPSMPFKEERLSKFLKSYQEAGGQILELTPEYKDNLLDELGNIVKPSLSITHQEEEIPGIYTVKRKSKDKTIWFILNTTNKEYLLDLNTDNKIAEIPLEDTNSSYLFKDKDTYKRRIKPYESILVQEVDDIKVEEENYPTIKVNLSNKSKLELGNKNLLRMYNWELALLDDNKKAINKAKVKAIPLSNQLEEGKFVFKPDNKTYFGSEPELLYPEMSLQYSFKFENTYQGEIELLIEPESIKGDWKIFINGSTAYGKEDLQKSNSHVRGTLGINITEHIELGENIIRIEIDTKKANDGLINPLYLAGDFGVNLEPIKISEAKDNAYFEKYKDNLIPYYSGQIKYTTDFHLEDLPDSDFIYLELEHTEEFNEASEISINDSEYHKVLWQPRCVKINKKELKQGKNKLDIRVYTSLIRSFEGSYFNYKEHCYYDV